MGDYFQDFTAVPKNYGNMVVVFVQRRMFNYTNSHVSTYNVRKIKADVILNCLN